MQNNNDNGRSQKKKFDLMFLLIVIISIVGVILLINYISSDKAQTLTPSEFKTEVTNGTIVDNKLSAKPVGGENYLLYTISGKYTKNDSNNEYDRNISIKVSSTNEISKYEIDNKFKIASNIQLPNFDKSVKVDKIFDMDLLNYSSKLYN